MRVGSLCTGIAGLELGLQYAGIETKPVFVSDIDPGACDWLEQTMPHTPNLGDFTQLDELPECDIITAGFPCQPFSTAGKRGGTSDERYLFDDITRLVGRMESRPIVFLENVPGLLTSVSHGEHAMARVVHGLADIGYYITWGTLPASAVGAPHRRNRWWGLAWHSENVDQKWSVFNSSSQRRAPAPLGGADSDAADTDGAAIRQQHFLAQKREAATLAGLNPPTPADATGTERRGPKQQHLPSPTGLAAESGERVSALTERFGPYASAIGRWERVLGRTAPDPSVDGRLNPGFVEWMMGYPEGWVTDTLTRRTQSLKALGNAVVPQCAAEAFLQLSTR